MKIARIVPVNIPLLASKALHCGLPATMPVRSSQLPALLPNTRGTRVSRLYQGTCPCVESGPLSTMLLIVVGCALSRLDRHSCGSSSASASDLQKRVRQLGSAQRSNQRRLATYLEIRLPPTRPTSSVWPCRLSRLAHRSSRVQASAPILDILNRPMQPLSPLYAGSHPLSPPPALPHFVLPTSLLRTHSAVVGRRPSLGYICKWCDLPTKCTLAKVGEDAPSSSSSPLAVWARDYQGQTCQRTCWLSVRVKTSNGPLEKARMQYSTRRSLMYPEGP
jgi:hypothetical protein